MVESTETGLDKLDALEDKLLDENGKPKNALFASIAAKKQNSVSEIRNNATSITTHMRRRTSQWKERSISKETAKFTEETPCSFQPSPLTRQQLHRRSLSNP